MSYCNYVQTTSDWKTHENKMQPLKEYLSEQWNTNEIPTWIGLWDNFEARTAQGLSLPNGVTEDIVNQVENEALWRLNALYSGVKPAKLR